MIGRAACASTPTSKMATPTMRTIFTAPVAAKKAALVTRPLRFTTAQVSVRQLRGAAISNGPRNDRALRLKCSALDKAQVSAVQALPVEEAVEAVTDEVMAPEEPAPLQPEAEVPVGDAAAPEEPADSELAPMNIVFVASEVAPWSKTGGLGDVMGSLPGALAEKGHRVMVIAPRYGLYEGAVDTGVRQTIHMFGGSHEVGYFHLFKNGVDYLFVDHPGSFLRMGTPYGDAHGEFGDNQFRFSLFTAAAVEAPLVVPLGGFPYGEECVFVANDWHTALVPVLLAAKYRPYGVYLGARSVLCIHNLFHQGCFPPDTFGGLGLDGDWYGALGWQFQERAHMKCYSYGHAINYMKGGISCADRILTVSPGYAHEITTPEGGWLMDPLLRSRSYVLSGIVNGMCSEEWSPEVDPHLAEGGYVNYSMDTLAEGKAANKLALQKAFGLPERPDVPLLGFIGRLDDQKGADLILGALPWLAEQDVQVVLLGSGKPDLEDGFRWAEASFRDKVRAFVGFNIPVSHQITAGVDIFVMPSRFEPCGLNQLYSMRYGTPVVAHATGGLRNTVIDVNYCRSIESDEGTGWTFDNADVGGLMHGLGCALHTYTNEPEEWRKIQLTGMARDSTWETAAEKYEEVFRWARTDPPYTG